MKIEIVEILDRAVANKERLWLKVISNTDLQFYVVFDTTYTSNTNISNLQRHAYWFNPKPVKAGDYVVLYTGKGTPSKMPNGNGGAMTHFLYWGLENTIWNKKEDCAVLFEVSTWQTSKQSQ
jgi:hypothetical protein